MVNKFSFRKFMVQVVIAFSVSALLICSNTIAHAQQPADVKFQFVRNGLTATCKVNGETVTLEVQRLSGNSSISRVRHSDGRILAEARRNADTVEFRIANATFTLNTANQSFVDFSDVNRVRLQEFLQSNDATIVRRCLKNLLQTLQQARDNRGRRVMPLGLSLVSMLLGEDQPSTTTPQPQLETSNRLQSLQNVSLIQSNVAKGLPRFATILTPCATFVKAGFQDNCPFGPNEGCYGGSGCNGCCGVGCACAY